MPLAVDGYTQLTPTASEPTPAEEAALRAKEKAEQDALPYKWNQTIGDLDILLTVPGNLKGRDLAIDIKRTSISAGVKGQEPIIKVSLTLPMSPTSILRMTGTDTVQGDLPHPIQVDESTWTLTSAPDGTKTVEIHLDKVNKMEWWAHVVTTAPKIDVTRITPDESKLSDLDGDTRGMVEKMLWDQRLKEMGKPSIEEQKQQEMLAKFAAQHPELDLSQAKIQ